MAIVQGSGHTNAAGTAGACAARLQALVLLRALCQAGNDVARRLISAGLGSLVTRLVLATTGAEPSQADEARLDLQVSPLNLLLHHIAARHPACWACMACMLQ